MSVSLTTSIALLLLTTTTAIAVENPGFERLLSATAHDVDSAEELSVPFWDIAFSDARATLDAVKPHSGKLSLRIESVAAADRPPSAAQFSQSIALERDAAERIRISAYARRAPATAGNRLAANVGLTVRQSAGGRLVYVDRRSVSLSGESDGWQRISLDVPIVPTADELRIGGYTEGSATIWFDSFAMDRIDLDALPEPAAPAAAYLRRALDLIAAHSMRRDEIGWPAFRQQTLRQLRGQRSVNEAQQAVQFALALLNDGHSYFMRPEQMTRLGQGPVSNARTGRPARDPTAALLGDTAYIRVPGFAGGSQRDQARFATALQGAIAKLGEAGHCGWIVDLRANRGGNLWPLLVGLGPLLPAGSLGATVAPGESEQMFWYQDGKAGLGSSVRLRVHEPVILAGPLKPIAILIDGSTASAAEILAMALAGQPEARSFGEPSRGATTATRVLPLSDGAAMVLAVAATRNLAGERISGSLQPDELIPSANRGEFDAVLNRAQAWIRMSDQCRP
jgi:C-terminal processing protease CtpA/Prc